MSYNPNIPRNTDNLSVSQGQIQENFQVLETVFSLDHFTWDATYAGNHKQATMLAQTSTTPAASFGTYYTSMIGTHPGGITEAVYKSGDTAPISLLSAVKAWGTFGGTGTLIDGWNVASVANPGVGKFVVTFINALPNANYGVLATTKMNNTFNTGGFVGVDTLTTTNFQINVKALTGGFGAAETTSFVVLKS